MLRRGLPGWTGQSLKQGGRVVGHHTEAFVGIDTSKLRNAVAIADSGRGGEVRYLGEFPATEAAIQKLVAKLAAKYGHLTFCYEAGPTGYGLYRLLKSLGHECLVAAPSLVHRGHTVNGIIACVARWLLGAALAGAWLAAPSFAADTIRLAVLKTGTVAWELAVIRAHGLDKEAGL